MTIDARDYLVKNKGVNYKFMEKPAILITGQHHAREHITPEMTLYSILKMIHGGLIHDD